MENEDTSLMLKLKDGEQDAFRQIVERNKLSVLNLCLRFTNNREDAEDLAQEVFMRIFEAAPRYKVQASFSTWLYRITVNLCLNHQRRKKIIQFFSLNHKSNSNHYAEYKAPELICGFLWALYESNSNFRELLQGISSNFEDNPLMFMILETMFYFTGAYALIIYLIASGFDCDWFEWP